MNQKILKIRSAITRWERKKAAYLCCLYAAGFVPPEGFKVRFQGNANLNAMVTENGSIDPSKGITLQNAVTWWTAIWDNYDDDYFHRLSKRTWT